MRTVLVVDDEFGVAEVLQAILEDEGYRVVTAINGKQGLMRLAEGMPDIVLLDFMMPIMNGAAMLAAMQANTNYAPIPVVMMSSLNEDVIAEAATGYAGFIRKPFLVKQVVETIARLLPGGREEGS
jgi:CheY-like chemotaxis protein